MKKLFTKYFIFIISFVLVFCSVTACSKSKQKDAVKLQVAQFHYRGGTDYSKIEQYSLESWNDIVEFIVSHNDDKILSYKYYDIDFIKAITKYNSEFFKTKHLEVLFKTTGSSSIIFSLKESKLDGEILNIYIKNNNPTFVNANTIQSIFIAEIPNDENIKTVNFCFV